MSLRFAETSDLSAIRAFGRRVLLPFYETIGIPETGEMLLAEYWESDGQAEAIAERRVIVADRDGKIVGVTEVGRYDGEPIIWKLYVEPAMRRRGVGLKLVDAAINSAAEGEATVLVEHPAENEDAAQFYDLVGFEVAWVDVGEGPGATTVWRRKAL